MKTLRWCCVLAIAWLFLLLHLERLEGPLGVAPFVYTLAGIGALALTAVPGAGRTPLPYVVSLPLIPYFSLKLWLGHGIGGSSLPVTVTEICVIELTLVLARGLSQSLAEVERVVAGLLIEEDPGSPAFEDGQGRMFREIRRARKYERPLALMAVAAGKSLPSAKVDRALEQLQRESLEKYTTAQIARLLTEETSECDLIARRGDHFVALLPESSRENASRLAERIQAAAATRLGLTLRVGLSSFPDQEVTFESLLDSAESEMRAPASARPEVGGARVAQGRRERGLRTRGGAGHRVE